MRVFILAGTEDDEGIFQLALTFLYAPSPALEALSDGNRWCRSAAELTDFQQFVLSSRAYRAALEETPAKLELRYEAQANSTSHPDGGRER